MVKGSFDFIGLNYYTSNYAANAPCSSGNQTFFTDACVILTSKTQQLKYILWFHFDISYVSNYICIPNILFVASAMRDGVQIGPKVSAHLV